MLSNLNKNSFFKFISYNYLLLIIVLKIILDFSYFNYVSALQDGEFYKFDFVLVKYILGWILYIIIYLILRSKKNLKLYEIYLLLYIIFILPNITYYSLSNQNTIFLLYLLIPFCLFIVFTYDFSLPQLKINKNFEYKYIIYISLIIILLVILNLIIKNEGQFVLKFSQVYDYRTKFTSDSFSGIFSYLNSWVLKVFSILIFSWSLFNKKNYLVLFSLIIFFLLFIFTGHKSILFAPLSVLLFYFLSTLKNDTTPYIIFLFIFLFVSVTVVDYLLVISKFESLFIRRMLIVPAQLNFTYFEFFSLNEMIYWSNGLLKSFSTYPYSTKPAIVIGNYLVGNGMNANVGFIATGFMHAGIIGIIIYSFIFIILANFINLLLKKNNKFFLMSLIFVPFHILFTSADLLTTLLTHGLILSLLIMVFMRGYRYEKS